MAKIWITEYEAALVVGGHDIPVGQEPSATVQTVTATGSTQSAALGSRTRMVRLNSDGNVHFKVGTDPTATADDTPLGAGVAEYFGVPPGAKIAFIAGA